MHLRILGAVIAACAAASPVRAQDPDSACQADLRGADFVGASADIARLLDLQAPASRYSFMIRRISDAVRVDPCVAPRSLATLSRRLSVPSVPSYGAALLPIDTRLSYNSRYARDWNEGAPWSGGGATASVNPGAVFRWGKLEAAIAPVFIHQGNMVFTTHRYPDTTSYSRFIHRWHGRFIDLPQRFGTRSATLVDAGQSYARVHATGLRAGISNENLAWGPARRNPLLMSGTAPGFPHVFLETSRARDAWLGDAEFQLFWGRLTESDYFDNDPANDHRALAGTAVTLRPRRVDGLYLGAAYLHMQTWWPGTPASDVLLAPFTGLDPDSSGLPRDLRLFSLFMRWAAAPGGLEVYGEWARQDSWQQWFRLLNRDDAAQAYTLGLQKIVRRGDNAVRFSAEVSHLSDALAHRDVGRGTITYYVSPHVPQGHTQRGQLLGAPVGPGSEAQFIGADVFWGQGRSSFSIERVRYDDDAYYAVFGQVYGPHGHDTELSFRAGHVLAGPTYSIEAELGYSFRYNRSFLGLHQVNFPGFPYREESNYGLRVAVRWQPPLAAWER